MDSLAPETLANVASFLDPQSLLNFAMVSKKTYAFVKYHETLLASGTNIYTQLEESGLLPLSLAISKSATHGPLHDTKEAIDFIDEYFPQDTSNERPALWKKMTLRDLLVMDSFHGVVERCTTVIGGLAMQNLGKRLTRHRQCSATEIRRIQKGLYLSQLLRNMFPRNYKLRDGRGRAEQLRMKPAWAHLWSHFAPWELQQARCVENLLAEHVKDVSQFRVSDPRQFVSFVCDQGVMGLARLGGANATKGALVTALLKFGKTLKSYTIRNPWYSDHDTMWLKQNGDLTDMDVTDVIEKYGEAETGPQDAWMHTLLQNEHDNDLMFDLAREGCFFCDRHATSWGYAFWDRQKLFAIAGGALPTTEDMIPLSKISLNTKDLFFNSSFRQESCGCSCYTDDSDIDYMDEDED